jgi:hypothetical protein
VTDVLFLLGATAFTLTGLGQLTVHTYRWWRTSGNNTAEQGESL